MSTASLQQYSDRQGSLGIGLEGHEQPYLRGGTHDVIKTGHTFSDEPGVYIEGKVSVVSDNQIHLRSHHFPL